MPLRVIRTGEWSQAGRVVLLKDFRQIVQTYGLVDDGHWLIATIGLDGCWHYSEAPLDTPRNLVIKATCSAAEKEGWYIL